MARILIKNANIVTDNKVFMGDVLIDNQIIERIDASISDSSATVVEAHGKYLIPGIIDDQVHFREPGLTHKADIFTESRAALAGGVTSFMEMPNVNPLTITLNLLEQKYQIAEKNSAVNFSFY